MGQAGRVLNSSKNRQKKKEAFAERQRPKSGSRGLLKAATTAASSGASAMRLPLAFAWICTHHGIIRSLQVKDQKPRSRIGVLGQTVSRQSYFRLIGVTRQIVRDTAAYRKGVLRTCKTPARLPKLYLCMINHATGQPGSRLHWRRIPEITAFNAGPEALASHKGTFLTTDWILRTPRMLHARFRITARTAGATATAHQNKAKREMARHSSLRTPCAGSRTSSLTALPAVCLRSVANSRRSRPAGGEQVFRRNGGCFNYPTAILVLRQLASLVFT